LHLPPALAFAALPLAWTFPLATRLSSSLPGDPGDNIAFLWNFWWMREAVARPDATFFFTDRLFAPVGTDLILHTHTALPAFLGATVLGALSTTTAQNVTIFAALALNGLSAYLLAYDRTNDRWGSFIGGLVFAGSPYIAAHLLGHFNLIHAWGIPLFVLYFLRAIEGDRRRWPPALAAGAALVAVAYTDYYYLVYCAALACAILLWQSKALRVLLRPAPLAPVPRAILVFLLAADLLLVGVVLSTGGFVLTFGSIPISVRRATNPLAFAWLLLLFLGLLKYRPRLKWHGAHGLPLAEAVRRLMPLFLVAAIGTAPLVLRGARLWLNGDYTSPPPSWRSGPGGIDLATMALGNPLHPFWGSWTRRVYDDLGLDPIESVGWLGVVPILFVVSAILRYGRDLEVRRWLVIAAVFFVWALGPWLRVAGFDTGLMLPQNLFAYIPVLSNARIPGRALVVVFLSLGLISAIVLSRLGPQSRRRIALAALVLLIIDFLPAPFPLTRVEVPALYGVLGATGKGGTVCELPVGIRDGFSTRGLFDEHVLMNQMVHGHPIVGGFAGRVAPSITRRYDELPVVRSMLALSGGGVLDPQDSPLSVDEAGAALRRSGVQYLVLNRATSPAALVRYVEAALPITLLEKDGDRELYEIDEPTGR
jgi:hypothetical protein